MQHERAAGRWIVQVEVGIVSVPDDAVGISVRRDRYDRAVRLIVGAVNDFSDRRSGGGKLRAAAGGRIPVEGPDGIVIAVIIDGPVPISRSRENIVVVA